MQPSSWHRRPPPLTTATALVAAGAMVLALTAAGLYRFGNSRPIATNPAGRTAPQPNPPPVASGVPAPIANRNPTSERLQAAPAAVPPAAPSAPRVPPASLTDQPASPTGLPPVPSAPPGTTSPDAAFREDPAERAAAAFATAYLSFHWSDDPDALRLRCRPWDTDELDAALAGPGVPPDRARRAAARETDGVEVRAVNPQDRSSDHVDASVAAAVAVSSPELTGKTVTEVIDLRVVASSAGWLVAQVSQ
jgi:hypothetical protein